jgi:hypothetical protein
MKIYRLIQKRRSVVVIFLSFRQELYAVFITCKMIGTSVCLDMKFSMFLFFTTFLISSIHKDVHL